MIIIQGYHTTEHRGNILPMPIFAEGNSQWLGDAFYFWQDKEFAEDWGYFMECRSRGNRTRKFDIYGAKIVLNNPDTEFIDTVFNEKDYYGFVNAIEHFAKKLTKSLKKKPSLEEFNDFIRDHNIWNDVKAIRFQDLPAKDYKDYLKVIGFYYKKRIQIAVYDAKIIDNFAYISCNDCLPV